MQSYMDVNIPTPKSVKPEKPTKSNESRRSKKSEGKEYLEDVGRSGNIRTNDSIAEDENARRVGGRG